MTIQDARKLHPGDKVLVALPPLLSKSVPALFVEVCDETVKIDLPKDLQARAVLPEQIIRAA